MLILSVLTPLLNSSLVLPALPLLHLSRRELTLIVPHRATQGSARKTPHQVLQPREFNRRGHRVLEVTDGSW